MSTNFLNRRMDLNYNVNSDHVNLIMDTSYPVRLAGKVIKIFTASTAWNTYEYWSIINTEKEEILHISINKIFDFAGRLLKDNIGEGLPYPSNIDVYNENDYVMVIIDFDNESLHICSESNFEKFITGGNNCKFKLFDISGQDEVLFNSETKKINTSNFKTAVEFEGKDDQHAFLRNGQDDIVYQIPEVDTDKDGNVLKVSAIPVAEVSNMNINSINAAVQNLCFPYINTGSVPIGFDTVDGFRAFQTISGSVNDNFVNKFCFTDNELRQLPLWQTGIGYIKTEYDNLAGNKSDFYYVFVSNSEGTDKLSSNMYNDSMMFIPIKKSDLTFVSFLNMTNTSIKCGNSTVSLCTKHHDNLPQDCMIGSWWGGMPTKGYEVKRFSNGNNDDVMKVSFIGNSSKDLTKNTMSYNYSLWYQTKPINDYYLASSSTITSGNNFFNNDKNLKRHIRRFIDFFTCGQLNNYNGFIKNSSMVLQNSEVNKKAKRVTIIKGYNNSKISEAAHCVIILYPEAFENVLFDEVNGKFVYDGEIEGKPAEYLNNYESLHNESIQIKNTTRKDIKIYYRNTINNVNENMYLVYALMDHNELIGYTGSAVSNSINTFTMGGVKESRQKVSYRASQSLLGNSYTSFINKYALDDSYYLMFNIVSKLNVTKIDTPYYSGEEEPDYNRAEIGKQSFIVVKKVRLANEYITYNNTNDEYRIKENSASSTDFVLYCVYNNGTNDNNLVYGKLTKALFKKLGSNVDNIMYLYYVNNENVYRVKYFYDSKIDNTEINKFDYFSTALLFNTIQIDTSSYNSTFQRAFLNYLMSNNSPLPTTISGQRLDKTKDGAVNYFNKMIKTADEKLDIDNMFNNIIIPTLKYYHYYPYNLKEDDTMNVFIDTTEFGSSSTINLNVTNYFDESANPQQHEFIYYAGSVNNPNYNNGDGFRLRDMIGNDYSIYQNSLVPYVSETIVNDSTVYNIASYNKVIKKYMVDDIFDTEEFPYLNAVGIREDYYKDRSIYEFYNYILTRDLSKPISDPNSFKSSNEKLTLANKAFFTKADVSKITGVESRLDEENITRNYFKQGQNDYTLNATITLNQNIDPKSIYGFNPSQFHDRASQDVTSEYIAEDKIIVNKEQTGLKTVYSLSVNDGNPEIPSIIPINGNLDEMEVDKLNWTSLLIALNNNRTINILGIELLDIKHQISDYFMKTGQNINDKVSIDDNITAQDANKHDSVFDLDSPYYKEHNADYDQKHDIYQFNYGYGFENNTRKIDNRGVIVFVTEGAYTNKTNDRYDFFSGDIYPKRMYISKDGLLCTKEYFEKENATSEDTTTTLKALEARIAALEAKLK